MLKLTKTGIGLLTKQYRSVLRKCLLLNFCIVGMLFFSKPVASSISHDMLSRMLMPMDEFDILDSGYVGNMAGISRQLAESGHYFSPLVSWINGRHEWSGATVWGNLLALDNALYNYYYTFRVDERVEVIEFAKELRSNKKEMSSLDFMPIKSSIDLQINLIKAEDPLTFSTKTRDDSLVLMEVCHA